MRIPATRTPARVTVNGFGFSRFLQWSVAAAVRDTKASILGIKRV